jgi:hypothetical protein
MEVKLSISPNRMCFQSIRICAQVPVGENGLEHLDVLDGDGKRPLRVGGLAHANDKCITVGESASH